MFIKQRTRPYGLRVKTEGGQYVKLGPYSERELRFAIRNVPLRNRRFDRMQVIWWDPKRDYKPVEVIS